MLIEVMMSKTYRVENSQTGPCYVGSIPNDKDLLNESNVIINENVRTANGD